VLLFCVCATRGIHSLFAVALLLLCAERLFGRAWYHYVSHCDVRDRRRVAVLSSGMTASGTGGLSCVSRRRWLPWCDAMVVRVSCRSLGMSGNQISGSIPSTVGSLTALT
jgi:hypothetical protein